MSEKEHIEACKLFIITQFSEGIINHYEELTYYPFPYRDKEMICEGFLEFCINSLIADYETDLIKSSYEVQLSMNDAQFKFYLSGCISRYRYQFFYSGEKSQYNNKSETYTTTAHFDSKQIFSEIFFLAMQSDINFTDFIKSLIYLTYEKLGSIGSRGTN